MRRLDWFLAGVVACFLVAVVAMLTSDWQVGALDLRRVHAVGRGEVELQRLVNRVVVEPMLSHRPE